MHVVAYQSSPQKHRVRCDVRASSLLDPQGGNIGSLRVLALQHLMGEDRVVTHHKLHGRIAQWGALSQGDVVLNYRGLALLLSHNQASGVGHEWSFPAGRYEQEIN